MIAPLSRLHDPVYAAMRIVVGLLFMMNGAQKLFGAFGGRQVGQLVSMQGAAGIIEFGGGLLVVKWLVPISSCTRRKEGGPFRTTGNWPCFSASSSCTSRLAARGC